MAHAKYAARLDAEIRARRRLCSIHQGFLTLPGQATRQAGQEEDNLAVLARREHEGLNARWMLVMDRVRDGAAEPAR